MLIFSSPFFWKIIVLNTLSGPFGSGILKGHLQQPSTSPWSPELTTLQFPLPDSLPLPSRFPLACPPSPSPAEIHHPAQPCSLLSWSLSFSCLCCSAIAEFVFILIIFFSMCLRTISRWNYPVSPVLSQVQGMASLSSLFFCGHHGLMRFLHSNRANASSRLNNDSTTAASGPFTLWQLKGEKSGSCGRFSLLRLQNHCRRRLQAWH